MMRKFKRCLARLAMDKAGNFALMTAFMLVPLIGIIGLGVDLSRMSIARTKLQMDLDAAVLGGANTLVKGTDVQAKKQVTDMLTSLGSSSDSYKLSSYNITVDDANNLVSATANASLTSSFLKVIGFKNVSVAVASQAKSGQDNYYELSLILDKSASMLLAATTTDQSVMKNLSLNCVFACHDTAYNETYQGVYYSSYYAYARAKNVLLRADVQTQAVLALMDSIDEVDVKHNRIKVDLFTLGTNTTAANVVKASYNVANGIRRAYGPTYDTTAIRTQLSTNTELTSATSYLTTDFRALTKLDTLMTAAGDGSSATKPKKIVVLITDGVQSSADWVFSGQANITPLNPTWCSNVKGLNATFLVLYTAYLPWTNRNEYNNSVGNTMGSSNFKTTWGGTMPSPSTTSRHDYIPTALTNCATGPEYYMSAASPTDIKAGLKALVGKSLEAVRLTQ